MIDPEQSGPVRALYLEPAPQADHCSLRRPGRDDHSAGRENLKHLGNQRCRTTSAAHYDRIDSSPRLLVTDVLESVIDQPAVSERELAYGGREKRGALLPGLDEGDLDLWKHDGEWYTGDARTGSDVGY